MAPSKKHLVAASATILISLAGLAAPSYADPATGQSTESAADVQQQVAAKQEELSTVNEEYLDAKLELDKQNAAKADADAKLSSAQSDLQTAKAAVAHLGAEQYKSGTLPTSVLLLVGESPADFIDKANAKQNVDTYNDDKIAALANAESATESAKAAADAAQSAAAQAAQTISDKKAVIEAELPKLQEKLASLTDQERASLDAAQGGTTPAAQQAAANPQAAAATEAAATPAAASGSAATVVSWAMSQRGKPYVWGGAGPNGYDCSGLTMMAYKQIGISLPHSSSGQQGFGTSVSLSALQPGDLVFAPGHVAIYIGNGTVVHAPTFGSPVRTMPMSYMDFTSARRLV
ncbi:C40 family peptidase [Cumulibacter manganitolerans]|uniref:C40 family peptidase n=1 Tax=Cumulibacter manganitolerans TaxID=1884992 RepID=UPI001295D560|nr:NlpC/P60 family protein [Cumulibacter manganitolerans]